MFKVDRRPDDITTWRPVPFSKILSTLHTKKTKHLRGFKQNETVVSILQSRNVQLIKTVANLHVL